MATLTLPKKKTGVEKDVANRTIVLIKREERITKATEWLISTYPGFACYLPLAIGVRQQTIAERPKHISSNSLQIARKRWCRSPRYLTMLSAPGSMRYNLDGTYAEPVSNEHRAAALEALAKYG